MAPLLPYARSGEFAMADSVVNLDAAQGCQFSPADAWSGLSPYFARAVCVGYLHLPVLRELPALFPGHMAALLLKSRSRILHDPHGARGRSGLLTVRGFFDRLRKTRGPLDCRRRLSHQG